jgi:hypothetical protein
MSYDEIRAKFDENSGEFLSGERRAQLAEQIARLELLDDASALVTSACPIGARLRSQLF